MTIGIGGTLVSETLLIVIFLIVFVILAYGDKMNYFDEVERDIKKYSNMNA